MEKWLKVSDNQFSELVVHEVKCPKCGFKVTYHTIDQLPESCYICGIKLEVNDDQI